MVVVGVDGADGGDAVDEAAGPAGGAGRATPCPYFTEHIVASLRCREGCPCIVHLAVTDDLVKVFVVVAIIRRWIALLCRHASESVRSLVTGAVLAGRWRGGTGHLRLSGGGGDDGVDAKGGSELADGLAVLVRRASSALLMPSSIRGLPEPGAARAGGAPASAAAGGDGAIGGGQRAVIGTSPAVVCPGARRQFAFVPQAEELAAGLADPAGEMAAGDAQGLSGEPVVVPVGERGDFLLVRGGAARFWASATRWVTVVSWPGDRVAAVRQYRSNPAVVVPAYRSWVLSP